MIRTEASGITLNLNQDTLHVEIKAGVSEWKWAENFRPVIVTQEEVIDFSRWQEIVHETFESGVERESVPLTGSWTGRRILMLSRLPSGWRRWKRTVPEVRRSCLAGYILNGYPFVKKGFPSKR